METFTLTPVSLLADSLRETHGLNFEKINKWHYRPDLWVARLQGTKLELEQQKRGQLRVTLSITNGRQQSLCETEALTDCTIESKVWGVVIQVSTVEEMADTVDALSEGLIESDIAKNEKAEVRGASFAGTVFERLQERGATMSGKFGFMVCRAARMELTETLAEWTLDSGRQLDGVELDVDTQQPISIYECQSGIHNGQYLDSLHRDKALGEYLYDPSILPTVRKVVILAGGYSDQDLRIIRERALELGRREQPISVILLRTVRIENEITVMPVDFNV